MEAWHDFYLMAGGASAALLGLLFVALTIQIRSITAKEHPELRGTAELILGNFVIILVVSFVALVPAQTKLSLGIDLAIVGLYGGIRTVYQVFYVRRYGIGLGPHFRLLTVSTAALASAGLIVIGAIVASGRDEPFAFVAFIVIILAVVATRGAWDLLIELPLSRRD